MENALAIACLLCLPASNAASAPAPDANAAWRELFAQPAPADANRQLNAVLAACGNDVGRLKALIAADTAYEAFQPGWHRRRTDVQDGNTRYDVPYLVRVPWGYDANRSWPLILACHGQGGRGGDIGWVMQEMLEGEANRYVIVTPTMPGPAVYNGRPYQEQAYVRPLEWARLHLNIDDDRVYITGYSLGGHQSWHLATMFPHLFAGAVPMAGVPAFEGAPYTCHLYHENLSHLPLWAVWGENDKATPPDLGNADVCREAAARLKALGIATFRGTELPGAGHGESFPPPEEFRKFLAAGRRQAVPEKLTRVFHLPSHRRAYWLEAVHLERPWIRLDGPIQFSMPPGPKPTTQQALDAGMKHLEKGLFRFTASLDRAANRITVEGTGIASWRLYLMDGMLDLSREVTIQIGSRTWRGRLKPSARAMLLHYAATRDAGALVLNEVDLFTTGRVNVRYGD